MCCAVDSRPIQRRVQHGRFAKRNQALQPVCDRSGLRLPTRYVPRLQKNGADFARHDVSPRQFRIREGDLICIISSWRVRFRCRDCGKVFTEYPPFALPYKRFAKPALIDHAKKYLQRDISYRQSVQGTHTPVAYDGQAGDQGRQLSRSTVWKWLTWLGSLKEPQTS